MTTRLATIVTHPIQHFAPWFRQIANDRSLDLRVFYCTDWGAEEYVDPEFGIPVRWDIPLTEGYDFDLMAIRRRPTSLGFLQVDNPTVGERLTAFSPDVVMVFGYATRTMWRAAYWAKKNKKPVLLYSDSSLKERSFTVRRLPREMMVRNFYGRVSGAFSVGDENEAFHRRYGIPPDRVYRGGLPVDAERIQAGSSAGRSIRSRFGIPDQARVVLFVGKLVSHKRPMDLLTVATDPRLRDTWFLFIGEGAERQHLEETARERAANNVIFTGFVNQSDVPGFFGTADILAVPSQVDPHPLVITEAGCCGVAILCSDRVGCIGPNDTARPGVNASVFKFGDPADLADKLSELLGNPRVLKDLQANSARIGTSQGIGPLADALSIAVKDLAKKGVR